LHGGELGWFEELAGVEIGEDGGQRDQERRVEGGH
jgi:hypothetical protein